MQKTVLHLLLKKISQGDVKAKDKVVPKLAERLVIVPSVKTTNAGSETKVSVITIREGDRNLIPIFTSMALLKNWLAKNEIAGEGLSLNCADICMVLGTHRWLMVDPGTDYWCEIEPMYVEKIAAFEPEEDDFGEDEPIIVRERPKPQEQKEELPPINKTMEVPIIPKALAQFAQMNPASEVKSFPRFRQKTEEDVRATIDLTNFKKKLTS